MLILAFGKPDGRNVSVCEALFEFSHFFRIARVSEYSVMVRQGIGANVLGDFGEGLDGPVVAEAAAEEEEAKARVEATQEFGDWALEVDVPVVAVGGVVLGLVEDAFGGVVEVAVEFQQVALAGGDGAVEGVDLAATGGLFDEGFAALLVGSFEYAVEIGGDGATIEEFGQADHGSGKVARRCEIAFEVEVESGSPSLVTRSCITSS